MQLLLRKSKTFSPSLQQNKLTHRKKYGQFETQGTD